MSHIPLVDKKCDHKKNMSVCDEVTNGHILRWAHTMQFGVWEKKKQNLGDSVPKPLPSPVAGFAVWTANPYKRVLGQKRLSRDASLKPLTVTKYRNYIEFLEKNLSCPWQVLQNIICLQERWITNRMLQWWKKRMLWCAKRSVSNRFEGP